MLSCLSQDLPCLLSGSAKAKKFYLCLMAGVTQAVMPKALTESKDEVKVGERQRKVGVVSSISFHALLPSDLVLLSSTEIEEGRTRVLKVKVYRLV